MSYEDKTLECQDCGVSFTFSADEQALFAERGYTNEPKRCSECRNAKKQRTGSSSGYGGGQRQFFPATCAQCGKSTEVPFEPRQDRPVYCRECYSSVRR